jgi:hypothetical protein
MPTGLSRAPTFPETFRRLFISLAAAAEPLIVGAGLGVVVKNEVALHRETPVETQAKAAQLWQKNGYEVTGVKSYEVRDGRFRTVTHFVKKPGDERVYQATAACLYTCATRKIEQR